jgi:hypothetical protein
MLHVPLTGAELITTCYEYQQCVSCCTQCAACAGPCHEHAPFTVAVAVGPGHIVPKSVFVNTLPLWKAGNVTMLRHGSTHSCSFGLKDS